jgi:hypothetical protein
LTVCVYASSVAKFWEELSVIDDLCI